METITSESNLTIRGVNVMLMGASGTGKTYSIGTLVDAGVEVFYLSIENGLESLLGYWKDEGKAIPENLHWHHLSAPKASFKELIDSAKRVNTMSLDVLAKAVDPNKSTHNGFIKMIEAMNDFHDDRTGKSFGSVDSWGTDRALVIDSMSSMNNLAMSLVIGGKPVKNQSDWGIAQQAIESFLTMLTDNCKCHFILLAHIERETDQILGGIKLMPASLGKALAPKLPRMFSDVILTEREGKKFTWNTGSAQADVKTRNLEIKASIEPDFRLILDTWKRRQG